MKVKNTMNKELRKELEEFLLKAEKVGVDKKLLEEFRKKMNDCDESEVKR